MNATEITDREIELPDFYSRAAEKYRNRRHLKDVAMKYLMAFGGISVLVAIILIAFYLLYVVLPMFRPAHIEQLAKYTIPGDRVNSSLAYAMEEQHEVGMRLTAAGEVIFFKTGNGEIIKQVDVLNNISADVTAFSQGDPSTYLVSLGFDDGDALLFQHEYSVTYPNDVRLITPSIYHVMGTQPVQIDKQGRAIKLISAQTDEELGITTIAVVTADSRLLISSFAREESLFGDEEEMIRTDSQIAVESNISHLVMDIEQRELYIADENGFIYFYDIRNKSAPRLIQRVKAVPDNVKITSLKFLSGGISILVGDSSGEVAQWFPVRDAENNYTLEKIRHFDSQSSAIRDIAPEFYRKGFLAIDDEGFLGIYHTTAHRTVKIEQIDSKQLTQVAVAPRANSLLLEDNQGKLQYWLIDNEHPEISWQSLWGKVWYESRDKPEYIWQSSSASSDFEPKFSLTPLVFGTFKAAFYAMLFAVPLAIMGAIYTAYFMSAWMRDLVKPSIEIMAALPTVILGFIAGLWFAPYVENHLPGMFLMLILVPASILLFALAWTRLPRNIRHMTPEGMEAALLLPVIIIAIVFAIVLSQPLEVMFFNGNMPLWLGEEWGITYDQRNSMVVGVAIGFAVIPTIFSISEDAIFGVPKHLTTGSLALGATPWQTMVKVVLLTASPGIFSAVMIGLGRAVGETMIVVMATGNTAIMDMNIFEGFRALSANIAVEMPESEVDSTHYRILFLAGFVLFAATFLFNTLAEVIRQRLRVKYSSL